MFIDKLAVPFPPYGNILRLETVIFCTSPMDRNSQLKMISTFCTHPTGETRSIEKEQVVYPSYG